MKERVSGRREGWTWFDSALAAVAVIALVLLTISYVRPRVHRSTAQRGFRRWLRGNHFLG